MHVRQKRRRRNRSPTTAVLSSPFTPFCYHFNPLLWGGGSFAWVMGQRRRSGVHLRHLRGPRERERKALHQLFAAFLLSNSFLLYFSICYQQRLSTLNICDGRYTFCTYTHIHIIFRATCSHSFNTCTIFLFASASQTPLVWIKTKKKLKVN